MPEEIDPNLEMSSGANALADLLSSYAASLGRLAPRSKRLSLALAEAEVRRGRSVARLVNDVRLDGANQLLLELDRVVDEFAKEPRLQMLTFVVRRAVADFETAIEATLSGYTAVAFDSMRDILEIEYLFKDFAIDNGLIAEWLNADEATIISKFSPASVRKRLQAAGLKGFGPKAQSFDYKGHSQMLHAAPPRTPILPGKGRTPTDVIGDDMGFWEIFQHAHGFWNSLVFLSRRVAPDSEVSRLVAKEPLKVSAAWRATHRAQRIFQAVIEAGIKRREGDEATAAKILAEVLVWAGALKADELSREDQEGFFESIRSLADGEGETLIRMAAMALKNWLEEPDDDSE